MDPFVMHDLFSNIFQLSISIYRSLKSLRNTKDPHIDEVYWRVITEREKTLTWAKQIHQGGQGLSGDEVPRIIGVLEKLSSYYGDVDSALKKVRMRRQLIVEKLMCADCKFGKLKHKLGAIMAMNDALNVIVPPLPLHSGMPNRDLPTILCPQDRNTSSESYEVSPTKSTADLTDSPRRIMRKDTE
jgi:hypothetical protein